MNVSDDVFITDDLTVTGIIEGKDVIKGVTVTGTTKVLAPLITGATVVGTTKVSGATVTGTAGQFTNLTATNITGTTLITGVTIKMSGDTVATQTYASDTSIVFAIALG